MPCLVTRAMATPITDGAKSKSSKFERIAVYCGASPGSSDVYVKAAQQLGAEMCKRKIKLVYGGGDQGLMGEISRAITKGLGEDSVMSVITEALVPREVSGRIMGNAFIVKDLHERKKKMSEAADAFIALPGGYGTLEELIEMVTWQQLGYHTKPVGILNINGFYDNLLKFIDDMVEQGFVRPKMRHILLDASDPAELIEKLEGYQAGENLVQQLTNEGKAKLAAMKK